MCIILFDFIFKIKSLDILNWVSERQDVRQGFSVGDLLRECSAGKTGKGIREAG